MPPAYEGVVLSIPSRVSHLDICIMVHDDDHLLTSEMIKRYVVKKIQVQLSNPRYLGFGAYELMEKYAEAYDWFVFSEDDLCMRDVFLFEKLEWFQRLFGCESVLAPNRYEWNARAPYLKTYIDYDLRRAFIDPYLQMVQGKPQYEGEVFGCPVVFERTLNPHSGFFAVNRRQLEFWRKSKEWKSLDVSFISPLESAATLGILKQFAIYKAVREKMAFLEIEHLDDRFSERTVNR